MDREGFQVCGAFPFERIDYFIIGFERVAGIAADTIELIVIRALAAIVWRQNDFPPLRWASKFKHSGFGAGDGGSGAGAAWAMSCRTAASAELNADASWASK